MQPIQKREAGADGFFVILREVTGGDFVSPGDDAAVDREIAIGRIDVTGGIAQERSKERGFTGAVAAEQSDFFAARDRCSEVPDDRQAVVGFRESLDFERMPAGGPLVLKADVGALDIGLGEFGRLEPLHFLLARGGLCGPGSG